MKLILRDNKNGQALIEYLIIMAFIALISTTFATRVGSFFGRSIGNLAYTLSSQLNVGVCKQNCFFSGYVNGAEI